MFSKLKKNIMATSIIALLGVMAMVDTASAAEFNWRFGNLYGRGTAFGKIYEDLAKGIETKTNGEIKVQVLFSGEGVGSSGLLGAAKSGLVQMIAPFQALNAGELPAGIVELGLPGGTADTDKLYKLFHEQGFGDILKKAYAAQGLVWLEPYIQPPVYIITKKPINSIADFQGLKIRAPGAYGKFLRNLGASPVSLAWSEIYTSLATGVIDGSIGSNMIDHRDGNHVEVAKYMYKLPLAGAQVLPILVNKSAWDKLSDKLKKEVYEATVDHAKEQLTKSRQWEKEAVDEMVKKGLKWSPEPSEADKAAWKKAGAGLWDEYSKKGPYSKQLIDVLRKTQN
ncbi:TRAP transporter substrate-binding protein [Arcobacter sp. F2176]|uniref:TRAP transporter substrate-binding protein n=1 Tax=unclassified Arcobacter TaxID=2593671 RepID=UPI00100BEA2A|nr:TRAP transporter substrate-binding protein [Arcobacter sp. F2176]RXJ79890.1 C4-dicarboxylate ABC transporter substrate-binding protein [Arcobacter sp. F2176]|eukprot:TRINITY_DN1218_c0_g1_i2.p1 TRINITY_DN1218_c0_g1~~TRINITY_DN1218_c0_g1_i2.p1  ORF type:complete len:339 (+),score=-23.02 TRINITY_DN1218_c0_g1_i2:285-1301(+)